MAFDLLLVHLCTIVTPTTYKDRTGQPASGQFNIKASGVHCRWYEPRGSETWDAATAEVQRAYHTVFIQPGVAVTEHDYISQITDASGAVIAKNLNILHVYRTNEMSGLAHHIKLICDRIRGATDAI